MQYLTRDNRELYIYNFLEKTKTTVCSFTKRDGIISHVKLLGNSLFYVKNTKDLIRFDMKGKSSSLIGTTKDAVIALNVNRNHLRELDLREEEKKGESVSQEIDEEAKADDPRFTLSCVDEAENVYIFKSKDGRTSKSLTT